MERIKDISKIKMVDGTVLLQVYKKESKIILPDSSESQEDIAYSVVIAVTDSITDLQVGDIVLDFTSHMGFKWDEFFFALVPRHSVKIAVSPENFKGDGKGQ